MQSGARKAWSRSTLTPQPKAHRFHRRSCRLQPRRSLQIKLFAGQLIAAISPCEQAAVESSHATGLDRSYRRHQQIVNGIPLNPAFAEPKTR